jgi:purine-binding chemotaxis protein CheW
MMTDSQSQIDGQILLVTFLLGDALFGIDAQQVQEVVRVGDITPVYHATSCVAGIRNLRGRIITVIDLRVRLNLGSVPDTPNTRILIVEWQNEPIGLLVDSVADTINIEPADIVPPPPNVFLCQAQYMLGVCRSGNRLVALLDPGAVLQAENQTSHTMTREQTAS